jgi:STE24 endopeptidase
MDRAAARILRPAAPRVLDGEIPSGGETPLAGEAHSPPSEERQPPPRAVLDVARQTQARRYARQRQALSLVNLGLSAVVLAVLLFGGLSFWLRDALAGVPGWQPLAGFAPLRVGAYFLVLFGVVYLLGLPLSYYGGYVLPRRYGLSTQSFGGWLWDLLKGLTLSLVFNLLAVLLVYLLLAAAPNLWWLCTGLAVLFVTAVLAHLAPILLLPIFYKLTPLPEGTVRASIR